MPTMVDKTLVPLPDEEDSNKSGPSLEQELYHTRTKLVEHEQLLTAQDVQVQNIEYMHSHTQRALTTTSQNLRIIQLENKKLWTLNEDLNKEVNICHEFMQAVISASARYHQQRDRQSLAISQGFKATRPSSIVKRAPTIAREDQDRGVAWIPARRVEPVHASSSRNIEIISRLPDYTKATRAETYSHFSKDSMSSPVDPCSNPATVRKHNAEPELEDPKDSQISNATFRTTSPSMQWPSKMKASVPDSLGQGEKNTQGASALYERLLATCKRPLPFPDVELETALVPTSAELERQCQTSFARGAEQTVLSNTSRQGVDAETLAEECKGQRQCEVQVSPNTLTNNIIVEDILAETQEKNRVKDSAMIETPVTCSSLVFSAPMDLCLSAATTATTTVQQDKVILRPEAYGLFNTVEAGSGSSDNVASTTNSPPLRVTTDVPLTDPTIENDHPETLSTVVRGAKAHPINAGVKLDDTRKVGLFDYIGPENNDIDCLQRERKRRRVERPESGLPKRSFEHRRREEILLDAITKGPLVDSHGYGQTRSTVELQLCHNDLEKKPGIEVGDNAPQLGVWMPSARGRGKGLFAMQAIAPGSHFEDSVSVAPLPMWDTPPLDVRAGFTDVENSLLMHINLVKAKKHANVQISQPTCYEGAPLVAVAKRTISVGEELVAQYNKFMRVLEKRKILEDLPTVYGIQLSAGRNISIKRQGSSNQELRLAKVARDCFTRSAEVPIWWYYRPHEVGYAAHNHGELLLTDHRDIVALADVIEVVEIGEGLESREPEKLHWTRLYQIGPKVLHTV